MLWISLSQAVHSQRGPWLMFMSSIANSTTNHARMFFPDSGIVCFQDWFRGPRYSGWLIGDYQLVFRVEHPRVSF